MFGILISEETLPKINENQDNYPPSLAHFYPPAYLNSRVNWYYVAGVLHRETGDVSWSCYPEYIFKRTFEYNPDKIKTDWDQIVKK